MSKRDIDEREIRKLAAEAGLAVQSIARRKRSGRYALVLQDGRTISAPSHVRDVHSVENWKAFARGIAKAPR